MREIKRRLAGVRKADERRVGEQLQVQLDVELVTRRPDLGETRHLPCRGDEPRVAAAAVAAARQHDASAGMREVGNQLPVLRQHLRADRNRELGVLAAGAVPAGAAAVPAPPRPDLVTVDVRREIAQRRARDEDDVTAVAAVAAVGAALGDVLLATEAETTVAALARGNVNLRAVAEHQARRSLTE